MNILLIVVLFVIALFITIVIHELGHFVTAKRAGVKVEEFGLGFPPRIYSIKRGETVYSINAIPVGAFVKAAGEDDPTVPRSLAGKGPWTRLRVYAAGPLANIFLAFILFSAFFMLPSSVITGNGVMVHSIMENSPAAEAGLAPGDVILKVNDEPIYTWTDMQTIINSSQEGEEITLILQRDGKQKECILEPQFDSTQQRWMIGVLLCWNMVSQVNENSPAYEAGIRPGDTIININKKPVYNLESMSFALQSIKDGEETCLSLYRGEKEISVTVRNISTSEITTFSPEGIGIKMHWVDGTLIEQQHLPVWKAIYLGGKYIVSFPALIIEAIPLIKAEPGNALVGPIGAGQLTIEVIRLSGLSNILFMAGIISIGLGLFNFLPLPPLDGGGMLVAFIEGLRRGKRLSQQAIHLTYTIGTIIIIALAVAITFNDILRLISRESFI